MKYRSQAASFKFKKDEVNYFENFEIEWFVTQDPDALNNNLEPNVEYVSAGKSVNPIYVTFNDSYHIGAILPGHSQVVGNVNIANPSYPLRSVVHRGCVNGLGSRNQDELVDMIYEDFKDKKYIHSTGEDLLHIGVVILAC